MRASWAVIRTIAKRELAAYFESPVAYVFLVIFLLLSGFFTFTFGGFFERGEASLAAFFNWLPWLFLFRGCSCFWCPPRGCACGPRSGGSERSSFC